MACIHILIAVLGSGALAPLRHHGATVEHVAVERMYKIGAVASVQNKMAIIRDCAMVHENLI